MIKLGKTPYWFDGFNFWARDRLLPHEKERVIYSDDHEPILRHLCRLAFGLNRWQGEPDDDGECWSMGDHSILVAALAGRLSRLRGLDAAEAALAVRGGAVHDLGETLGLGDPAAPWLRGDGSVAVALRAGCARHQAAVDRLAGLHGVVPGLLVGDADRLAAALERRIFFSDDSRDTESADAERLIAEVFGPTMPEERWMIHVQSPAKTKSEVLLELVMGRGFTSVKVAGIDMLVAGKAVAP